MHIFDKKHSLHASIPVCALIKQWEDTGYIDLEPQEWKKKTFLAVCFYCFEADVTPIKQDQHLARLLSAFCVSRGSDLKDTLCSRNQTHQFFFFLFFFPPSADIHLFTTSWKKKRRLAKKHTWPSSSSYVESRRGEVLLQRVMFECLGGGMCRCVSLVLCVSAVMKSLKGMGQFVIKCSVVTGCPTTWEQVYTSGYTNLSLTKSSSLFAQTIWDQE